MNKQDKNFLIAIAFMLMALSAVALAHVMMKNQNPPRVVKGVVNHPIACITDEELYHPSMEEIEDEIIDDMCLAFAIVESNNKVNAWNKKEDAVGVLQIRRVMVDEANNCLGEHLFSYEDRWDRNMSYYMFEVVQRTRNPELDIDQACDVWNPNCPRSYRDAVKTQFFLIQFKKMNGSEWVEEHMDSIVTMLKEMNIKPIDLISK